MNHPKSLTANGKISPETIAAIFSALKAGGYLTPESRIVGLRRQNEDNLWKRAGIMEIMLGRDISRYGY